MEKNLLFTLDSTSLTESDDELADEQKFSNDIKKCIFCMLIKAQFQWEAVSMRGALERFALAFPWKIKNFFPVTSMKQHGTRNDKKIFSRNQQW